MTDKQQKIQNEMNSIIENIERGLTLRDSINKTSISQSFFYRYATDEQKSDAYEALKLQTKYGVGIKGNSSIKRL